MTFIERISQSYIQHTVQLTNGQTGSIIMLNKLDITRPLIQVGSQFVDLSLKRDIAIAKFIDEFAEEN